MNVSRLVKIPLTLFVHPVPWIASESHTATP